MRTRFTTLNHESHCETLLFVPRPLRKSVDTPESRALDESVRAFDRLEAQLERQRADMQAKAVAAVRAGMSRAEAARRAKYSREYVSRLVSAADACEPIDSGR
jgi:hypothetical protein